MAGGIGSGAQAAVLAFFDDGACSLVLLAVGAHASKTMGAVSGWRADRRAERVPEAGAEEPSSRATSRPMVRPVRVSCAEWKACFSCEGSRIPKIFG